MNIRVERRESPLHRERVLVIGALWGTLTFLAVGAAWMQTDDAAPAAPLSAHSQVAPRRAEEASQASQATANAGGAAQVPGLRVAHGPQ